MNTKELFTKSMQGVYLRAKTLRREIKHRGVKLFSYQGQQFLMEIDHTENAVKFTKMTGCEIPKHMFLNVMESDADLLYVIAPYLSYAKDEPPLLVKKENLMGYMYYSHGSFHMKQFANSYAEFSFEELYMLYAALKGKVNKESFVDTMPIYTSEYEELEVMDY